jgi:hypothetical protein
MSDIVHMPAFDAKPVPETVTVKVPTTCAIGGDRVIEGLTVKVAVPLSAVHITVRVTPAPPAPDGPDPTTKDPYTFPVTTLTYALVMTELPLIEQLVPSSAVVTVPSTIITSPSFPFAAPDGPVRVSPIIGPACALGIRLETGEITTNSAVVSNSTRNRELYLRVVNLGHAVMMWRVGHI